MKTGKQPLAGKKVALIAIDAMSLDFVRAHLDALPTLRALLAEGAVAELSTVAEHASASVWPTFAVGEGPGEHGHYFPFQWDPSRMKFARTADRDFIDRIDFEPFWHSLARAGAPVIALDPGTPILPAKSPCIEINNWSYQSSGIATASDPRLLKEIRRRFGRRPIGKEVTVPKTLRQSRQIRDDMIDAIRRKTDATLWLMNRFDWNLFIVGYYEIHRAGHNLLVVDGDFGSPADRDALLAVYQAQDRELARLFAYLKKCDATVALFALHGMAPNRAQDHFLPAILHRLNAAWRAGGDRPAPRRDGDNLMSFLRKRLPHQMQYSLAYILGERIQDWVINRALTGGFDWAKTPSFRMLSGGEGYVRFNIKGREAKGIFDRDGEEFRRYARWLKERLAEIEVGDSAGPLFSEIVDTSELTPGRRADFLPDLILKYAPDAPVRSIRSPIIGTLDAHLDTGRGGNHCGAAFIAATGPGAAHAAFSELRDIKDIKSFVETLMSEADSDEPAVAAA
jgi:hypothetical protein